MCRATARSGRELREAVDRLAKACGECIDDRGEALRIIYPVPQVMPDEMRRLLDAIDLKTGERA